MNKEKNYYRVRMTLTNVLCAIINFIIIAYFFDIDWFINLSISLSLIFGGYTSGMYMDNNAEYFDDKGLIKRSKPN